MASLTRLAMQNAARTFPTRRGASYKMRRGPSRPAFSVGMRQDRRAPSAGLNRFRFQGFLSIPSGIPLAAAVIILRE